MMKAIYFYGGIGAGIFALAVFMAAFTSPDNPGFRRAKRLSLISAFVLIGGTLLLAALTPPGF